MSDTKAAENPGVSGEKSVEHQEESLKFIPKTTNVCGDINHVASLGLENAAELEKTIVRKLDMWMLPQMWILYMFNYLNRNNVAQARLSTLDEDLNLQDGDYQVRQAFKSHWPSIRALKHVWPNTVYPSPRFTDKRLGRRHDLVCGLHDRPAPLQHAHYKNSSFW